MKAAPRTTVVLVDDHDLVREGTKRLLRRDPRIEVVGEASGSQEAMSLIEKLQPDVVVLDIRLREGSGLDVAKACQRSVPRAKVLVLSAYDNELYVKSLLKLGIRGYIVKTSTVAELRHAIRDVTEGKLIFSAEIADKVLRMLRLVGGTPDRTDLRDALTHREREVLDRMGDGLTNREIGNMLGISMKTVEVHVRNVLAKLGASSRTQAVAATLKSNYAL